MNQFLVGLPKFLALLKDIGFEKLDGLRGGSHRPIELPGAVVLSLDFFLKVFKFFLPFLFELDQVFVVLLELHHEIIAVVEEVLALLLEDLIGVGS